MAKDILAFFGLIFLTMLVIMLVAVVGYYYDELGLVNLPKTVPTTMARILGTRAVTLAAIEISQPQWTNPLEALPSATWSPSATPRPTATPVRPLDPVEYRTEVIIHLKRFVGALERWLEVNRRLGQDNSLIDDPAWRTEMDALLREINDTGSAMAAVGPPPPEYEVIARLLGRVQNAANALQINYNRALTTRAAEDFRSAGEDFERIKSYLSEVVTVMLATGWTIE